MIYRFAGLTLDIASRLLSDASGPIEVPRRVFDCLAYLIEHRDRAIGRDELIRHVWGRDNVSDTQLAQTVLRARRLVSDDGAVQRLIRTVPGFGYHWVGPVEAALPGVAKETSRVIAEEASDVVEASMPESAPAAIVEPAGIPAEVDAAKASRIEEHEQSRVVAPRPRRGPFIALAATACVALFVALALIVRDPAPLAASAASAQTGTRILVLPLTVAPEDRASWARLGVMDLIATRLREGGFAVTPSENVMALLASRPDGRVPEANVLREQTQAAIVVQGRARRLTSGWRVELEGARADGLNLHVDGQHADLIEAAVVASDALLASLGRDRLSATHGSEGVQRVRAAMLNNALGEARDLFAQLPDNERARLDTRYLGAEIEYRAGRLESARDALDAMIREARQGTDRVLLGRMLIARGSTAMRLTDFAGSDRDFLEAVALLEASGATREYGRAIMARGLIAMRLNRADEAMADLGHARMLLESVGDDLSVARATYNTAVLGAERGQFLQALPQMQQAARTFETYGAVNELSRSLAGAADLAAILLRWRDADALSQRASGLLPRLADPHLRESVHVTRANVLLGLGLWGEAARELDQVDLDGALSDCLDCARARVVAARLALLQNQAEAARALIEAAMAIADNGYTRAVRDRAVLVGTQAQLRLIAERGDRAPDWPRAWLDRLASTDTAPVRTARALRLIADHDLPGAERELRAALAAAEAQSHVEDALAASQPLADLLLDADRIDEASAVIGRLTDAAEQDFDGAMLLVRLYHRQGDTHGWSRALDRARALAGERRVPRELAEGPPRRPGQADDAAIAAAGRR